MEELKSSCAALRGAADEITASSRFLGVFKDDPESLLQRVAEAIDRWRQYRLALNEATPPIEKLTSESLSYGELCARGERLLAEEIGVGGSVPDLPSELGRDRGLAAAKELSMLASRCQDALRRCDRVIPDTVQFLEIQLRLLGDEMIPTLYGPPTFEDEMLRISSMLE